MVLITLLRHAPLPLEYQKKLIGHCDIEIDLSLCDVTELDNIKNRKYDYIFCSDLKRCKQTLDLIGFDYTEDKRLREVKFKEDFKQKSFSEIEKFDSYDMKYLSSMASWHNYVCEESLEDFRVRLKSFFEELPKDGDILICSHAGAIKMLNSIIENENYEKSLFKINYMEYADYIV